MAEPWQDPGTLLFPVASSWLKAETCGSQPAALLKGGTACVWGESAPLSNPL